MQLTLKERLHSQTMALLEAVAAVAAVAATDITRTPINQERVNMAPYILQLLLIMAAVEEAGAKDIAAALEAEVAF